AKGYASRSEVVRGSIQDARLSSFVVEAVGTDQTAIELAKGAQNETDLEASLQGLAEGAYDLRAVAEDAAENRKVVTIPFTIDDTPPEVQLLTPAPGAMLARGRDPISVIGTVTDANLEGYTLRVGAGANPVVLDALATASTGGQTIELKRWEVSSVPDGVYT